MVQSAVHAATRLKVSSSIPVLVGWQLHPQIVPGWVSVSIKITILIQMMKTILRSLHLT